MNTFDHLDADARQAYLLRHPLITNKFTTLTPSMPDVLNIVLDAVMLYKKSVCFNALPQMGKTTVCRFCSTTVEGLSDYRDREVLVVSVDPSKHESIIKNIAGTIGLPVKGIFRLDEKRREVVDLIDSRLRQKRGQHLVLFVDEAQALKIVDFENLQFVQNALALRNLSMTMIGFSQTQIENVITLLRAQGRPELIVRFLNEVYDLPRCQDQSWIKSTTTTFDEVLVYPAGSKCTFTQFFLPQAFDAGFRLSSYSDDIFGALDKAARDSALPAIPTFHILETFRFILIRSRHNDNPDFILMSNNIDDAVIESQIANYSNYLKKPSI